MNRGLTRQWKTEVKLNNKNYTSNQPDVQAVKSAASGRESEILQYVAGIDAELLDGKHHPCPKCGGHDRFRLIDATTGGVFCNQCFRENNRDYINAVMWMCEVSFQEALSLIAEYLGMNPVGGNRVVTPAKVVKAVVKSPTPKTNVKPKLLQTLLYEYINGVGDLHVLVKRLEFADGSKICYPSRWDIEQQRYITGKGCMQGVIAVPWDAPAFKEASMIYWCEGEKKTVALSNVMAQHRPEICCSCRWGGSGNFPQELVGWFHGKDVVIFADHDAKGEKYARMVAAAITGTAKSVKIVSFPDCPEKYDIADWLKEVAA